MGTDRTFFEQFLEDYFSECEEHLMSARTQMLLLEQPDGSARSTPAVLDELLRSFHSLKGLSAMVGIEEVTQLSHYAEDYLREIQKPSAALTTDGISQMLAGISMIEQVLSARRNSEALPDIAPMLMQLANATQEAAYPKQPAPEKPADIPQSPDAAGEQTWTFEFRPSAELAAAGITVNVIRERLRSVGRILRSSPQVSTNGNVVFEFLVASQVAEADFQSQLPPGVSHARTPEYTPTEIEAPLPAIANASLGPSNVVRVEMSRLDDLMRVVGELVISRYHLDETVRSQEQGMTIKGLRALQDINTLMGRQLSELRESVMRVRMVPIGQVFERMRFVVRGLGRDTQKKINVEISGQNTEIDKIIVERMMDPLLHLVRNSVSHGIETADVRVAAGKEPVGKIHLSAATAGDSVLVVVEDDGRGIDIEKVTSRARELGVIDTGDRLDPQRLLDVISAPGFTTRDAVDLSSGRGVGMAAVQSAVRELGGLITLESAPGKGTKFSIQLPLTLAIADAMLVTVERQRFAVPQTSIQEVLSVESSAITRFENNEIIDYRSGVLPILRLGKLFGLSETPPARMHVLVIGKEQNAVGFAVDRITGQREIVVRSITDPLLRVPGIVGATELGDGRPVLIVDVHSLIRAARPIAVENAS